jgi:hypothetical protein
MTYTSTAVRRYRPRRKPPSLSGWFEDFVGAIGGASPESTCLSAANAMVAPFDAKIDDLAKNWNPTGFYTPADLRALVSSTMAVVIQAQNALGQAAQEPNASQDSVMRATDDLARAGARSLDYLQAARDADAQGLRVVNAPGMKRWVTDTMGAASSAMVTASVIGCITPWWVGALAAFQGAFDAAWNVAKKLVGAIIAIGETALQVVDDLPQFYAIAKWGLLALGGYLLWEHVRSRRSP